MPLLEILTHGKHNKPYAVATYIHVNGAICLGNCFGFQKERNWNDFVGKILEKYPTLGI